MTRKDIILSNKGLLQKELSIDTLQTLSDVLDSPLDSSSKETILNLTLSLKNNFGLFKSLNRLCSSFFLNEKLNKTDDFKEILHMMQVKEAALNASSIDTYATIGKKAVEIGVDDALELVKNLLKLPNDYYGNFRLVSALLNNDKILKDIDRFYIIADVLTKNEASYDILNGKLTEPYIVEVLSNDAFDYSKRQNINFRKIVELSINNLGWHFIYTLLKNDVSTEKIKLATDYYSSLYDKYITRWSFVTFDTLNSDLKKKSLYMLPLIKKDLAITDYEKCLSEAKNSSNPLSHTLVQVNDLDDERKSFVLNLIDSFSDEYNNEFGKPESDYLVYLARISVSPLMRSLDIDSYKNLILYMKTCIIENQKITKEKDKVVSSNHPTKKIQETLCTLFEKAAFLSSNIPRLEHLISLIKTITYENYYVIREIISIATSPNSMYYTEYEFRDIENLLALIHNKGYVQNIRKYADKYFTLKYLFTNNNVPFMDKSTLFTVAMDEDEVKIKKITDELNTEGIANRNVAILDGTITGVLEKQYSLKKML